MTILICDWLTLTILICDWLTVTVLICDWLQVYDTRARAAVMTAWEHQQMVLGLRIHQGHSLLSGCADGVIKVSTWKAAATAFSSG